MIAKAIRSAQKNAVDYNQEILRSTVLYDRYTMPHLSYVTIKECKVIAKIFVKEPISREKFIANKAKIQKCRVQPFSLGIKDKTKT